MSNSAVGGLNLGHSMTAFPPGQAKSHCGAAVSLAIEVNI